jgi:hypothetical protein
MMSDSEMRRSFDASLFVMKFSNKVNICNLMTICANNMMVVTMISQLVVKTTVIEKNRGDNVDRREIFELTIK